MARGRVGGQRPADYGYYRCTGTDAHRFAGQAVCDNRSVRSDRLEQAVWDEIRAVLEDPERVAAEHRRRLAEVEDGPNDAKDADLGRRIAALRRGIGRLIDAYAEGLIERGEFEPRVEGMRRRLAHAEKERQTMAANAEAERDLTLLVGCLEEFAEKVHRGLQGLDWEGTREIMRAMVRRVEVDGDRLDIVFRVPPPSRPGGDDHPGSPTPPSGRVRQDCRGRHAVLVGEDADHVCTALHFLVQALDGVRAVELRAVLGGEGHVGEDVVFRLVHQVRELRPAGAHLVGDMAPGLAGLGAIGLAEGLADGGGHDGVLAARDVGQRVAHPMDAGAVEEVGGDGGYSWRRAGR